MMYYVFSKLAGPCWLERMFYSSHRLDKDGDKREDYVPLTQVVSQHARANNAGKRKIINKIIMLDDNREFRICTENVLKAHENHKEIVYPGPVFFWENIAFPVIIFLSETLDSCYNILY